MGLDIRYVRSGGVAVADQVVGDGGRDLVFVPDFCSDLVHGWESPLVLYRDTPLASVESIGVAERVPGARKICVSGTEASSTKASARGLALAIGARICGRAAPDQVVVSRTVKDLVAGSGCIFTAGGEHELKGVPDRRQLFAAGPRTEG